MSSTEQERAEFEAWAKAQKYDLRRYGDTYDSDFTSSAWDGWQAARRAQVVPVWYVPVTASMGTVQRATEDGWNECVAAMLAAVPQPPDGLISEKRTTKPEAAPAELPKPFAITWHDSIQYPCGFPWFDRDKYPDGTKLYTEHQVRQLLAAHGVK